MGTTAADAVRLNICLVLLQWLEVRVFANCCIESILDFVHISSSFHVAYCYYHAQSYNFILCLVLFTLLLIDKV